MTQNEIIEMARQAGFYVNDKLILDDAGRTTVTNRMEAFAKLVTAKEREACAKVADEWVRAYQHPSEVIAKTIRARGEQRT